MEKGSETGSSLLWEVERLLKVAKEEGTLPRILLMENVRNLVSRRFKGDFDNWCEFLETLGYTNSWKILNAKDYGIPQNRERVYMFSILCSGYEFPEKMTLTSKLSDFLEDQVDDKYFMSEKLIETFTDLENRNGYIRGLRFRPLEQTAEHSWTITTKNSRPTDNYIVVPENTKRGYTSAEIGDGIYINRPHQKRGVVQKSKIPTLKTSCSDVGVVVKGTDDLISIRRLTPRECWRLMGWKDEEIDVAFSTNVSDTQLYKMAGNSIVVNCLSEMFRKLKGVINGE